VPDRDPRWAAVDALFEQRLLGDDHVLDAALRDAASAGLPPINVSPTQGKLLHLLVRSIGAGRVLEIGTLAGYSAIWMARALPADGQLTTLEVDGTAATVARRNLDRAGVGSLVEIVVGPALDTLPRLSGPFDLVFVDADKPSNAAYVDWAVRLGRPGTVIVVDNVVRDGAVADTASDDPNVRGVQRLLDALATDDRVDATAIQTVGSKGYDGFVLGIVR
jgi:predicted O-methyltransferase YrrM